MKPIAHRLMARNRIVKRRTTHTETVLDEQQLGAVLLDFVQSFRVTSSLYGAKNELIINMDETPVPFDPETVSTYEFKGTFCLKEGSKKVSVKKTTTTAKCSALLAVSLSGEKVTPMVVFQANALGGKVAKESGAYDQRSRYTVGPKGFCDTRVMVLWVKECLSPFITAHGGGKGSGRVSILMMDNFSAHLTKETRDALAAIGKYLFIYLGCVLVPLPANATSRVQILDVGVNKPFKNYYKAQKDTHLMQNARAPEKVTRSLCATWIAEAWERVTAETILNTARKIGFQ